MKTLLIANRDEIARRIVRTARRMGIATVAVYSDAYRGALHVREADTAVALGGTASADSYLRTDKLIAAARASGADAVHPGYGFLSENADFAQAVIDADLTWVGPPPAAIRALGSKSAAKAVALRQGVPVLPGYFGADQSDATFAAEAQRIGYPVMVKAVAGGGGRGMRLVHSADQLPAALQSARSEAQAGFGNGDLLIERALLAPRHVEVQVFADAHGHCIHLGERDCSVQRRHQKIIEESPSPAVSPELRAELGRCAVALAQGAGYVGAGTVEFLLDGDQFFLMEMNTPLQVEHPVTEMLTGLDLVEWQLRIARGEALPLTQEQVQLKGHAIEVRLCAEDQHFTPARQHGAALCRTAAEHRPALRPRARRRRRGHPALRRDAGQAHRPRTDPRRGHREARRGAGRDGAARPALQTARFLLPVCATRCSALARPAFPSSPIMATRCERHWSRRTTHRWPPRGAATWLGRPSTALSSPFARPLRVRLGDMTMDLQVRELGHGALQVQAGEQRHQAHVGSDTVTLDGVTRPAAVVRGADGHSHVRWGAHDLRLQDLSHTAAVASGSGPAARELRAPFNGKLVAVAAQVGDRVTRGQTLLTIESMKIEHQIAAPRDGTVASVAVAPGQQVAPGQVLVTFETEPT